MRREKDFIFELKEIGPASYGVQLPERLKKRYEDLKMDATDRLDLEFVVYIKEVPKQYLEEKQAVKHIFPERRHMDLIQLRFRDRVITTVKEAEGLEEFKSLVDWKNPRVQKNFENGYLTIFFEGKGKKYTVQCYLSLLDYGAIIDSILYLKPPSKYTEGKEHTQFMKGTELNYPRERHFRQEFYYEFIDSLEIDTEHYFDQGKSLREICRNVMVFMEYTQKNFMVDCSTKYVANGTIRSSWSFELIVELIMYAILTRFLEFNFTGKQTSYKVKTFEEYDLISAIYEIMGSYELMMFGEFIGKNFFREQYS